MSAPHGATASGRWRRGELEGGETGRVTFELRAECVDADLERRRDRLKLRRRGSVTTCSVSSKLSLSVRLCTYSALGAANPPTFVKSAYPSGEWNPIRRVEKRISARCRSSAPEDGVTVARRYWPSATACARDSFSVDGALVENASALSPCCAVIPGPRDQPLQPMRESRTKVAVHGIAGFGDTKSGSEDAQRDQFSIAKPPTRRNSRSLFETRVSFRATA